MFRKVRRKVYKKVRFKTWYRKMNHYNKNIDKLDDIIADFKTPEELSDKKYYQALRKDIISCLFKYGSYFKEYFLFGFEGQDDKYRSSFITEGIRMSFYPRMNDPKNTDMLENKYRTYKKFKEFFKRDMISIRSKDDFTEEALNKFIEFTEKHPRYIVKPIYAAFGKGVHFEEISDYSNPREAWFNYHVNGAVLEEPIQQGEGMACIHPQSVNTLRVPTAVIKDENGEPLVKLFNPTLRVGMGESIIDNFSAGGISALIDPESGMIYTDGADKKGHRFECHPDTGVKFKGFQIPNWDEAKEIVSKAALMVPGNHYCGWDLAYTKNRGWCMVEANCTAQMSGMQLVTKTGRRAQLEDLISKM